VNVAKSSDGPSGPNHAEAQGYMASPERLQTFVTNPSQEV
jgi:hypothetical protein